MGLYGGVFVGVRRGLRFSAVTLPLLSSSDLLQGRSYPGLLGLFLRRPWGPQRGHQISKCRFESGCRVDVSKQ